MERLVYGASSIPRNHRQPPMRRPTVSYEAQQSPQDAAEVLCEHRLVAAEPVKVVLIRQKLLHRAAEAMKVVEVSIALSSVPALPAALVQNQLAEAVGGSIANGTILVELGVEPGNARVRMLALCARIFPALLWKQCAAFYDQAPHGAAVLEAPFYVLQIRSGLAFAPTAPSAPAFIAREPCVVCACRWRRHGIRADELLAARASSDEESAPLALRHREAADSNQAISVAHECYGEASVQDCRCRRPARACSVLPFAPPRRIEITDCEPAA